MLVCLIELVPIVVAGDFATRPYCFDRYDLRVNYPLKSPNMEKVSEMI